MFPLNRYVAYIIARMEIGDDPSPAGRLTDHLSLGVLSGLIHRDLVDEVVNECGRREKRSRLLPAHVVVYYVLALNLFFNEAYEEVMRRLVAGLQFLRNWEGAWTVPSTSAISQARARLGEEPLKVLFDRVAVPMAAHGIPGARFHRWDVMAIDGVVLDVPDSPDNEREFGRSGNHKSPSPFPQVRVLGLGQCGTRAIVAARLGPVATAEQTLATQLVTEFNDQMLVLADRGFYSYRLWTAALGQGTALLWRVSATLTLPVQQALPDGSYRSVLLDGPARQRVARRTGDDARAMMEASGTPVRVIEYQIDNRAGNGEIFCLITSILDHDLAPATELAALYHSRWEFELALDEIQTHQMGNSGVLRSRSPELVRQEIWSLLLVHYAIRHLMRQAADTVEFDADRLSFMRSIRAIRRQTNGMAGFSP